MANDNTIDDQTLFNILKESVNEAGEVVHISQTDKHEVYNDVCDTLYNRFIVK